MAVRPKHKIGFVELHCEIHPDVRNGLRKRARELGYPSTSFFLRCILNAELRSPSMPAARSLIGRSPRKLGLSRPRRSV
jgi:hypothetical protein